MKTFPFQAAKRRKEYRRGCSEAEPPESQKRCAKPGTGGRAMASVLPPVPGLKRLGSDRGLRCACPRLCSVAASRLQAEWLQRKRECFHLTFSGSRAIQGKA